MAFRTNAGRGSNGHGVALFATTAGTGATQLVLTTAPGTGGASPYTVSPTPVVTAKSGAGVTDTSFVGVVTVTLNVLSGSPVLSGTTTKTAVAGVADFSANGLTVTGAGTWTLTFSSGALSPAVSATGTTTSSAATKLTITTAPGLSGTTPYTLSPQPVVAAQNAGGSTDTSYVTNVVASLNVLSGSPVLSGTTTQTPVSGVATFTDLVVTGAGTWTITFTSGTLTSATSNTGTTTAGSSAPTVVQMTTKDGTAGTTVSSSAFSATTGNLIHVTVDRSGGAGVTISVADNAGNTYTQLAAEHENASFGGTQSFYAKNITGNAALVVTATFSSSVTGFLAIAEISGASTTSPVDAAWSQTDASAVTSATTAAINTVANALVLAYGRGGSAGDTHTATIGGGAATSSAQDASGRFVLAAKSFAGTQTGLTATIASGGVIVQDFMLGIGSYKP